MHSLIAANLSKGWLYTIRQYNGITVKVILFTSLKGVFWKEKKKPKKQLFNKYFNRHNEILPKISTEDTQ